MNFSCNSRIDFAALQIFVPQLFLFGAFIFSFYLYQRTAVLSDSPRFLLCGTR
jgi:hypothetical protein